MISSFIQRFVRRLRDGKTVFTIGGYVLSVLYGLTVLIPVYFVLVSSFKPNMEIFGAPLALPSHITFENYADAVRIAKLPRAMGISLGVTAGAEILTLVLAFPVAYAIARIRTRLAPIVEGFFSLGFLIPAFATLVPIYLMTAAIGLLYNPVALILIYPAFKLPVTVLLLASYMRSVPRELEESAEIDGATRLQMIYHIFFPLARPGVVTVVVLNFIDIWNEFLFALVLMNMKNRTLQIAVSSLKGERLLDYGLMAAGIIITLLPVYIVFLIFQEQVVRGLYAGAVKS